MEYCVVIKNGIEYCHVVTCRNLHDIISENTQLCVESIICCSCLWVWLVERGCIFSNIQEMNGDYLWWEGARLADGRHKWKGIFFPLGYFWSRVNVFFIHDYLNIIIIISAILLCCSVAKSCPTLCDPMNYSMPGFPVLHYLLKFVQTHVHWVGDAIEPSHPRSSPSPPAFNLSQHQGLFQWISSSH